MPVDNQVVRRVAELAGRGLNRISDLTGVRAVIEPLPHPERPSVVTLPIPGYKQTQDYTCGFIAAANVLHLDAPDAELAPLYDMLDDVDGTDGRDVVRALRRYSVRVQRRRSLDFEAISDAILSGRPVIVAVQATFSLHWIVVYGVDLDCEDLYICGNGKLPVLNYKAVPYDDFCQHWDPPGNGLVCNARDAATPATRTRCREPRVLSRK